MKEAYRIEQLKCIINKRMLLIMHLLIVNSEICEA